MEGEELRIFLIGDTAACAKARQKVPQGYYNVELMISRVAKRGVTVGVCGTCMDARGIAESELTAGTQRSTLEELAQWTVAADKVLVF
ncbi:MAG TPA: DsrE family protein [Burkholderiales bacterium]|nr:DsrE family protein [Burkholderiales bacterium]